MIDTSSSKAEEENMNLSGMKETTPQTQEQDNSDSEDSDDNLI